MPTHEISEQNVRPLREYGSNLLFLALATVLGLAAAATGVYFITLGGLFPAMILWFVIAGPCLKFVWNDFGRIQVAVCITETIMISACSVASQLPVPTGSRTYGELARTTTVPLPWNGVAPTGTLPSPLERPST
jgi:hypothetical protein